MVIWMDELKVAYESIDSNNNLNDGLKENFKELVQIFHQNFGEVSLNNFSEKIKGLKIEKGNKYITKEVAEYNAGKNVMYLNEEKLASAPNGVAAHEMMYVTVALTAANNNSYGFDVDGKVKCLNVGVTEMIANALVLNEKEEIDNRKDLSAIVNMMLVPTMSVEQLTKAYFANDQKSIETAVESTNEKDGIYKLIETLNYGMELNGLVNYDKIEKAIEIKYAPANIQYKNNVEFLDEEEFSKIR